MSRLTKTHWCTFSCLWEICTHSNIPTYQIVLYSNIFQQLMQHEQRTKTGKSIFCYIICIQAYAWFWFCMSIWRSNSTQMVISIMISVIPQKIPLQKISSHSRYFWETAYIGLEDRQVDYCGGSVCFAAFFWSRCLAVAHYQTWTVTCLPLTVSELVLDAAVSHSFIPG